MRTYDGHTARKHPLRGCSDLLLSRRSRDQPAGDWSERLRPPLDRARVGSPLPLGQSSRSRPLTESPTGASSLSRRACRPRPELLVVYADHPAPVSDEDVPGRVESALRRSTGGSRVPARRAGQGGRTRSFRPAGAVPLRALAGRTCCERWVWPQSSSHLRHASGRQQTRSTRCPDVVAVPAGSQPRRPKR